MEGTLFIVGGGLNKSADEVFAALIERAGGPNSRFAFVVSASGEGPDETYRSYVEDFEKLGVPEDHCVLVPLYAEHVRDERGYNAFTGDADGLCELLDGVTGVWFTGGDQYFTAGCFLRKDGSDTRLLTKLREIYANGGVIGGSSAGAAIMSEVMIANGNNRGVISHDVVFGYDTYDELCELDDPCEPLIIAKGLGFFPYGVVDQHFNKRPRLLRSIEACLANDKNVRMGYAVSEDTALVYHAGTIEVLGSASVYLIDCRNAEKTANGCYNGVVLGAIQKGDRYDLASGEIAFAQECAKEEREFYRDYVTDGIINSPVFDSMVDRFLLRGKKESMYFCEDKNLPYIKGAVVYEAYGETYLVVLKYFKGARTCGYLGAHASFANVELSISTTKVNL